MTSVDREGGRRLPSPTVKPVSRPDDKAYKGLVVTKPRPYPAGQLSRP